MLRFASLAASVNRSADLAGARSALRSAGADYRPCRPWLRGIGFYGVTGRACSACVEASPAAVKDQNVCVLWVFQGANRCQDAINHLALICTPVTDEDLHT